jgi:hypothetical protein
MVIMMADNDDDEQVKVVNLPRKKNKKQKRS